MEGSIPVLFGVDCWRTLPWHTSRTRAAATVCPTLRTKRVTAHTLRHTAAMRLLEAGVDTTVIALWLGHEHVDTTAIYLQAHLAINMRPSR